MSARPYSVQVGVDFVLTFTGFPAELYRCVDSIGGRIACAAGSLNGVEYVACVLYIHGGCTVGANSVVFV